MCIPPCVNITLYICIYVYGIYYHYYHAQLLHYSFSMQLILISVHQYITYVHLLHLSLYSQHVDILICI